jgi:hypothetical protein
MEILTLKPLLAVTLATSGPGKRFKVKHFRLLMDNPIHSDSTPLAVVRVES